MTKDCYDTFIDRTDKERPGYAGACPKCGEYGCEWDCDTVEE